MSINWGTAFGPKWSLGYSGSTMSYTDAPDAQEQLKNLWIYAISTIFHVILSNFHQAILQLMENAMFSIGTKKNSSTIRNG